MANFKMYKAYLKSKQKVVSEEKRTKMYLKLLKKPVRKD